MAHLDLVRAHKLIKSAKDLLKEGDTQGVAGLAYQAFESASMALLKQKNGYDRKDHYGRRKRIKALLTEYTDAIDELWQIRNIDFYGNSAYGASEETITIEDMTKSLAIVEKIIQVISVSLAR